MTPLMKKLIAESIGTFCLVFAGIGAIVINDVTRGSVVGIAMTFGLIVMTMIYTLGDISGAHLNPAITFGFLAARRFEGRLVLPYILSQLSGAILASLTLRFLFHEHATLGATLPAGAAVQSFSWKYFLPPSSCLLFSAFAVQIAAQLIETKCSPSTDESYLDVSGTLPLMVRLNRSSISPR
jgi:glycerol uptake facilitator-like aquaporin